MTTSFLIGSPGVPGYGGLSTAGYRLYARLLADGRDVSFVNLIGASEATVIARVFAPDAGNPERLPHVHDCRINADGAPALAELVRAANPDVLIGLGHAATIALRSAAPGRRVAFLAGTCRAAQDTVTNGLARDAISLEAALASVAGQPRLRHRNEERALAACDILVAPSALTLSLFERCYPAWIGRIWPEVTSWAEWICDGALPWRTLARPFDERDIDLCVVAADWSRREKNYPWVEALAAQRTGMSIHLIGQVPREIPGVTHHGLLASRDEVMALMGRSRCVAAPSLIDAAPGVLFEAAIMGCNVVASRNCGNWELCSPDLLVQPFEFEAFVDAVRRARVAKRADRLDVFLARAGYADLLDTLDALARPLTPAGTAS